MKNNHVLGYWLLASVLALAAASCGGPSNSDAGAAATVDANGWQTVEMQANWATTKFDSTGHFDTTRNACGKSTFGSVTPEVWNKVARDLNQAVTAPLLTKTVCTDLDHQTKMDGSADLILENGKKLRIIENRYGNELCTYIKDPVLAKTVFEDLVQVVQAADTEECPNGWGG